MFESDEKQLYETTRGRAVAAGTIKLLKKTSSGLWLEVACAFLMSCLLFGTLFAAVASLGPKLSEASECWKPEGGENDSTNVYFVKHENRTWTSDELCNIESAARLYPQYNMFVINIKRISRPNEIRDKNLFFKKLLDNYIMLRRTNTSVNAKNLEIKLKRKLTEVSNVYFIDTDVEKFFSGTIFSKNIYKLSSDVIELAGKFQVIWDSPGISLAPSAIHQLESVKNYFENEETDSVASIQMNNDFQATKVPCQSFVGTVIKAILNSESKERRYVLKNALGKHCSSLTECKSLRILRPIVEKHLNFTDCPVVKSGIIINNVINSS